MTVNKDDCMLFAGTLYPKGYGLVSIHDGKRWSNQRAHRLMYMKHVGAIEDGLVIDHLCRTPQCINPDHLEKVTVRENTLRGNGSAAQYARRKNCPKGHSFSGHNLIIAKDGHRKCRECIRRYARVYYHKKLKKRCL